MRIPRVSIRSMIFLILVIALDCAWAPNVWKMKSVFQLGWHCLDLPVVGMANILAIAAYPLVIRWWGRPFLTAFFLAGLVEIAVYLGLCWTPWVGFQQWVNERLMVVQNEYVQWVPIVDANLNEPGYVWRYVPLDALLALTGTLPLTLIAVFFGLIVKLVAVLIRRSVSSTGSPRSPDSGEIPPG